MQGKMILQDTQYKFLIFRTPTSPNITKTTTITTFNSSRKMTYSHKTTSGGSKNLRKTYKNTSKTTEISSIMMRIELNLIEIIDKGMEISTS